MFRFETNKKRLCCAQFLAPQQSADDLSQVEKFPLIPHTYIGAGVEPRDCGSAILRGDRRRGGGAQSDRQRAEGALHAGGDAGEAGARGVQLETGQAGGVLVQRDGARGQV